MKNKYTIHDGEEFREVEMTEEEWHEFNGTPSIVRRFEAYEDIGIQLNYLYDDIDAGLLGAKAKTGAFYQHIKSIKSRFPKS